MKLNLLLSLVLPSFDDWFPASVSDPDTSGDDTDTDTDGIFDGATDDPFEGVDASVYMCTCDVRSIPVYDWYCDDTGNNWR